MAWKKIAPSRSASCAVLQKAVDLTGRSQSADGGWIYTPNSGGDEGSVTITQLQGIRACRNAGIAVPKKIVDRALGYLDKSMLEDGGIAYRADRMPPSRPPITAAAVACWYNAGQFDNKNAQRCARILQAHGRTGRKPELDLGALLLRPLLHGPGDVAQRAQGLGMVFPDDARPAAGDAGVGRIVGWRLGGKDVRDGDRVVILQMPYQYLPILQR